MPRCSECAAELREDARFCDRCGAPVEAGPTRETRKVVTVLFCDVVGFTAAGERLDPEALRRVQSRYFEQARAALERHGGSVEKFIGDAVMAVFGVPQVHEDDALRAVRAAVELREALAELCVRIGINTGEVVAGGGDALVTGDAVNRAKRLEEAAPPGAILLGERTYRLVPDAVEVEPADGAYRLLEVRTDAPAFARRLDAPLVGRAGERALLVQAFERAARERACHLITVLGPAGIGKSRLAAELCKEVAGQATILEGRCLSYGEGITFWPLVEIFRAAGAEAELERALSATAIEDTFRAVRKALEVRARERPLVAVFDDIHWAEPTLLDLVEHLADWSRDVALLLVCLARPDLLDTRPGWGGGKRNATSLFLEPLSAEESDALLDHPALTDELRAAIASAAEGNPLFVEQMLAVVAERGTASGELDVPPTIQALLAGRLDSLSEAERSALERASVVGKEFELAALSELTGSDGALAPTLLSLVRKELIRPGADDETFRFRHDLIRDAAYEAVPKELRADLHERFADFVEATAGEQLPELEEILGYHLEQACGYRRDLGPLDDRAEVLARRAAERLRAAGDRALIRQDLPAAAKLLERAAALLATDDPERLATLPDLGVALTETGELGRAKRVLAEAVEGARASADRRTEFLARLQLAYARGLTESAAWFGEVGNEAAAAIDAFTELGDEAGLARAWHLEALRRFWAGLPSAAEDAWERAVENARSAADERQAAASLPWLTGAAYYGPRPAPDAERRIAEVVERGSGDWRLEAWACVTQSGLAAMQGRFAEARDLRERARALLLELGVPLHLTWSSHFFGYVELLAGDLEATEAQLRHGYDLSKELGETGYFSTTASYLADAVYRQGRYEEALRLTEEAEAAGAEDDVITQVFWRAVRAKALARLGDHETAEALGREAVERVRATEFVNDAADALAALAETVALAGKRSEAREALQEALELYERKGNLVSAERTRTALAELP